jgi:EAL domain-containing protein (putative c-di-GMP-specific phosphodiesterase class I)
VRAIVRGGALEPANGTRQSRCAAAIQVTDLSATLGLRVIAEGIETAGHLARLRELGCDYGQGYFFSKPVDAPAIEALLASGPAW